jgi:hypothetical protein
MDVSVVDISYKQNHAICDLCVWILYLEGVFFFLGLSHYCVLITQKGFQCDISKHEYTLINFTPAKHNLFKVHPCCSMYQYFVPFLWLTNIPLYGHMPHFVYLLIS